MKKTNIKKVIGLILIALGLGVLLSSIALNVRQYTSKKNTVAQFKQELESGEALMPSGADSLRPNGP